MKQKDLKKFYEEYELDADDFFKNNHYTIITRTGVDKIQARADIKVEYQVIQCTEKFCVVKAIGARGEKVIETFGSALYGLPFNNDKGKWEQTGTTNTYYVMEVAEKRAMARVVLKLAGLYELGVFSEDESPEFMDSQTKTSKSSSKALDVATKQLNGKEF